MRRVKGRTLGLFMGIFLFFALGGLALASQYDVTKNLPVTRYTQQTSLWCGPACAQMYLEYDGCDMIWSNSYMMQFVLYYDYIEPHNDPSKWGTVQWVTDPCGMEGGLGAYQEDYGGGRYKDYYLISRADPVAGTLGMASFIHNSEEPSAALIYAGAHWVLPKGGKYRVETTPVRYEGVVKVYGFWVHDPAPGGWNDVYVTADDWVSDYFTPIQAGGSAWDDKVVYVADPSCENQDLSSVEIYYDPERGSVSGREAKTVLEEGLRSHGFYSDDHPDRSMIGATLREPIFVKSEGDFPDYYIVPIVKRGSIVALGMVDAEEGEFMGLTYAIGGLTEYPTVSRGEALDKIKRGMKIMDNENPELVESIRASLELSWKPCIETWSPYMPFWSAKVEGNPVYIGQGGEVFENLNRI